MEPVRGYPVRVKRVAVGGRSFELLLLADSDALLDNPRVTARFDQDGYMPYWSTLWPAALLLADVVADWDPVSPGTEPPQVLELGCGVGLVGLVAATRGYRVTLCDYDEDALAFAELNAGRNGVPPPQTRLVDWRQDYDDLHPNRIVAADVLYEARSLEPIARFVARHLHADGFALIADANRSTADPFEAAARQCGLHVAVMPVERRDPESGNVVQGRIFACSFADSSTPTLPARARAGDVRPPPQADSP